jgi:hypothetical protein
VPDVAVQPVERKLSAIFAADIAGCSRLMAHDEVGTLARLKACRTIIDGLIATHRGRRTTNVLAFTRKRPARQPFPEHLPRERVVEPGPTQCLCCGSPRLRKLGEDITETLEVIPRQWKVIQHVREKFTCRDCEKISQARRRPMCWPASQVCI